MIFSNWDLSRVSTDFQNLNFIYFLPITPSIVKQLHQFPCSLNNDNFKEMALTFDWTNDSPKTCFRDEIRTLDIHYFRDLGFYALQKWPTFTMNCHFGSFWSEKMPKIICKNSLTSDS